MSRRLPNTLLLRTFWREAAFEPRPDGIQFRLAGLRHAVDGEVVNDSDCPGDIYSRCSGEIMICLYFVMAA